MDKYYKWKVLLIIAVIAFSIWRVYPPQEKIHLGLDLQGGMQILLRVELDKIPADAREDATNRVVEIIRNRIDEFGVREPVITKQAKDLVVVQLPGITDRERAKEIVGKTAHLEFKLVSDDVKLISQAEAAMAHAAGTVAPPPIPTVQPEPETEPKAEAETPPQTETPAAEVVVATMPEGYEYKTISDRGRTESLLLKKEPVLTGDHLVNASVGFDQYGQPIVQLSFDTEGAKIFDRVTFENIGKRLAIVLDGKVDTAPVIRDRIPNGQAQISGNFSSQEASDIALVLRAGALPAPVVIEEERTVGPTLGRDSVTKGIKSGLWGALFVFTFMPVYYLLGGLIADIALLLYIIATFGALAAFKASLTLPGIAGFILSIGMAVDANILIFERIREELQTGKTPRAAISAGYHKAFSAIFDSNLTTLITSVILFIFGTGPVKGFAVTLSIGIIASMFSAIVITRAIFDFLTSKNPNLNFKMLQLLKKPKFAFLKNRFWAYGFSVFTLAIGVGSFFLRGQENYGVEFTGGTLVQIRYAKVVSSEEVRSALEKVGLGKAQIQRFGMESENEFVVKVSGRDTQKVEEASKALSGEGGYEIVRVDSIGPAVSRDLTKKALWAVFWSSLGILVYLAWRFEWKFALAAVVALLHDTLFAFGVYSLAGREINLPTVAAILTIMGYSVNDTIVTFDRVRDNLKIFRKMPFRELVELSINETLSRTILTSLTVLFATSAIFFFGGGAINDFAFILLIGFCVGIYSTIFVASALIVDLKAH
ncbi:MAG: protein translocase subunit SecD [Candidatus Omnitrophica bacterium]|nr:protein translocase subunit SecD [Candidatus Omnitrophota bacterium]